MDYFFGGAGGKSDSALEHARKVVVDLEHTLSAKCEKITQLEVSSVVYAFMLIVT